MGIAFPGAKMMKTRTWICLGLALLAAACTTTHSVPRAKGVDPAVERYSKYALAPVDSFVAFRLDSWTALSRNQLLIWPHFNEAYLVTVWDTCFDLPFAERIGVEKTGSSVTKFDKIIVGRDRCPISEIRPIDLKKMKADQAAAKAGDARAAAP
jgi:hypothetical protein